jgi:spore germination protein KB
MKAKIDRVQYFFLIPNLLYGKGIGITAGITARVIGGDAWLSMTIGFLIGIFFTVLMIVLGNRFPEKTMIQYSEELIGSWFSKLLGGILVIYFGIEFAVSANVVTLHLKEYLLPETPFIMLCIIYIALCAYAARLGVEVVIRFSIFGFIMIQLINITMMLGTIRDFQLINLMPFFDRGIVDNIKVSIYSFSDMSMVILSLGIVYPMLNNKKKGTSLSVLSIIVSIPSIIIWPFFEIGVLGADVMKQFVIVCMQQVRSAQLTRYLPRYELIMVSFFIWGCVVKTALLLFCTQYCIKQISGIKKDWAILLFISVVLTFITNYMGFDHNKYIEFLAYPWSQLSTALAMCIPLLLFTAAIFKGRLNKGISVEE